jgi:transposase-like protein
MAGHWHVRDGGRVPRKKRFENRGAGKGVKERLDRATLARLYVDEGLSQAQIARGHGCSHQFISLLLTEYGIARPSKAE